MTHITSTYKSDKLDWEKGNWKARQTYTYTDSYFQNMTDDEAIEYHLQCKHGHEYRNQKVIKMPRNRERLLIKN